MRFFLLMILFATSLAHAGMAKKNTGWKPGQTISLLVDGAMPADLSCIESVIHEINSIANIRLSLIQKKNLKSKNKIDANLRVRRLQPGDKMAGESDVGNSAFHRETVRLMLSEEAQGACSSNNIRTIRHEFGHLLGLNHEHQHPDAPKFISDLIADTHPGIGSSSIDIYDKSEASKLFLTVYDPMSVMHYTYFLPTDEVQTLLNQDWTAGDGKESNLAFLKLILATDLKYDPPRVETRKVGTRSLSRLIICPPEVDATACWDGYSFELNPEVEGASLFPIGKYFVNTTDFSEGDKAILRQLYPFSEMMSR